MVFFFEKKQYLYSCKRFKKMITKNTTITNLLLLFFSLTLFTCHSSKVIAQDVKISKKAISFYNEAETLTFSRKIDDAIEKLENALKIEPNYKDALLKLAQIYQSNKSDYKKAIAYYTKVIILNPNSVSSYYNKAICEFNIQDFENSRKSINSFLNFENIKGKNKQKGEQILRNIDFSVQQKGKSADISLVNLGANVNTSQSEYFPSVTSENKYLYFTYKRIDDNYSDENIYYAENVNDKWANKKPLNSMINSKMNEGAHCVSANGKYLLFSSDNYKYENLGRFDIFITKRLGGKWQAPFNMGKNINSRNWDSQPVLSADSKKLLFVSVRKDGFGGSDIYISKLEKNGKFGEAVNIGDVINTPFDEQRPYLHPDGKTLYFSSAGHAGFGESDLFKSTLDANGNWSKPINLGYPINTSGMETAIFVSSDGQTAYISSDREGGYGGHDIYSFEMPKNIRPELVSYIKGIVSAATENKPIKANIKLYDIESNKIYKTFSSDKLNGEFLETIVAGKEYAFVAEAKGYLPFSENISLKDVKQNEAFIFNVNLEKIENGKEITLKNVFFNSNEYKLLDKSKTELNYFVSYLKENPNLKIEIGGHTDNVGASTSNQILSENRAKSVMSYLISKEINKERLTAKGYGASQAIATNETKEGRAENRRTSFKIGF